MALIALRNLLYDKVRFAITLAGITVAILLVFLQGGMYLGFMSNASGMIDRTESDVWIVSRDSPNFDWSRPFPERYLNKVRSTPGVREARTLIFAWAFMRMPTGGTEQVEIIGYHPSRDPGWGEPRGFLSGDLWGVLGGDSIIVDESGRKRLGGLGMGSRVEIMGREVRVVGITRGIKSMTTAPYVFTSYENAKRLASYIGRHSTVFILVRAEPGVPAGELKRRLAERLPHVDVLTRAEYSRRTRLYWTVQTGMGFGFLMMTALALGVGFAIVGQTIYAATMEHLREYATLKALGASNSEVRTILWVQAAASAVLGYLVGLAGVGWMARALEHWGLTVVIPSWLYGAVFVVSVALCLTSAVVSVRKALALDPALVFKS